MGPSIKDVTTFPRVFDPFLPHVVTSFMDGPYVVTNPLKPKTCFFFYSTNGNEHSHYGDSRLDYKKKSHDIIDQ